MLLSFPESVYLKIFLRKNRLKKTITKIGLKGRFKFLFTKRSTFTMHHVYIGSYANATYVGMTENLTKRLYTHKARYNQTIDGSDYFCYRVWRNITESFDEIEWKIVKSFKSKEAAKNYEIDLIKKIGNLNDQHSETSQKYKNQMLIESMKHYE